MYTQSLLLAGSLLATTALCQDGTTDYGAGDPSITDSALLAGFTKVIKDGDSYIENHVTESALIAAFKTFQSTQTAVPDRTFADQNFEAYNNALAGQPLATDAPLLKEIPSTLVPFVTGLIDGIAAVAGSDLSAQPGLSSVMAAQASVIANGDDDSVQGDVTGDGPQSTQAKSSRSGTAAGVITSTTAAASTAALGSGVNGTAAATGGSISVSRASASMTTSSPSSSTVSPKPSSGAVKLSLAFGGLGAVGLAALVLL